MQALSVASAFVSVLASSMEASDLRRPLIFQFVLACYADTLLYVQVIAQLNGRYSVPMVRQAVEWLSNEGHLYTTHDDHHFKSTAM